MSAVFSSEYVFIDSVLILGILGWVILVPLVSILQLIWKWTDDELDTFFVNPITRWIMTNQLGYVTHTGKDFNFSCDYCYLKYDSDGNLDGESDGLVGFGYGVGVIFCVTVIAFLVPKFPLTALVGCIILTSLHATRFVKRLARRVDSLEK